jgi:hypothetical protein
MRLKRYKFIGTMAVVGLIDVLVAITHQKILVPFMCFTLVFLGYGLCLLNHRGE